MERAPKNEKPGYENIGEFNEKNIHTMLNRYSNEIKIELINAGIYQVNVTQYKLGDETIIHGLKSKANVKDIEPNLLKLDLLRIKYEDERIIHNKKELKVLSQFIGIPKLFRKEKIFTWRPNCEVYLLNFPSLFFSLKYCLLNCAFFFRFGLVYSPR